MPEKNHLELTPEESAQWAEEGFFIRHNVFSPAEVDDIKAACSRAIDSAQALEQSGNTYFLDGKRFVDHGGTTLQYEHLPGSETLRVVEPITDLDEEIDSLCDDPRLAVPMLSLVGDTGLSLWTAKLNLKTGGGSGFGWHQDSPYWIHDCDHVDQLPNVMLTLHPQSPANGCFRVIRGSHRRGILPGTDDGSQLGGFFTDPNEYAIEDQVAIEADAGALIFFNPHSVHGSEPNPSDQDRSAIIFTFQPGGAAMLKTGNPREIRL